MKVRLTPKHDQRKSSIQEYDLADYLEPKRMGSTQGAIEQVEAEVAACRETIGRLMAYMVEKGMPLEDAATIVGRNDSWGYSEIELVP